MVAKFPEELKFHWQQFNEYCTGKNIRFYSIFTFRMAMKSVTNIFRRQQFLSPIFLSPKLNILKSYTVGSKPPGRPGHALFRSHFAGQLEKMVHDDPDQGSKSRQK